MFKKKPQATMKDLEEMNRINGLIKSESAKTYNDKTRSDDPVKVLRVGAARLDVLYRKFEAVAEILLKEKRSLFETREAFFFRISEMPEDELMGKILRSMGNA